MTKSDVGNYFLLCVSDRKCNMKHICLSLNKRGHSIEHFSSYLQWGNRICIASYWSSADTK